MDLQDFAPSSFLTLHNTPSAFPASALNLSTCFVATAAPSPALVASRAGFASTWGLGPSPVGRGLGEGARETPRKEESRPLRSAHLFLHPSKRSWGRSPVAGSRRACDPRGGRRLWEIGSRLGCSEVLSPQGGPALREILASAVRQSGPTQERSKRLALCEMG